MISDYEMWKRSLINDESILGGATVFPNSRLSVFHIGELARKGYLAEIFEDYPYLSFDDIRYAAKYVAENCGEKL